MPSMSQIYDKDFYAWAMKNAELIRKGKHAEIDFKNIAEELESMGRSDKRELVNRFAILLAHLLKWQFQPARRSKSWKYTIKEQRIEILDLLEDSPSLKHEIELRFDHAYEKAVVVAAMETGFEESDFPKKCPFKIKDCLSQDFLPE